VLLDLLAHAEQLRRTEVDALQSTLGISDLYLAVLDSAYSTLRSATSTSIGS